FNLARGINAAVRCPVSGSGADASAVPCTIIEGMETALQSGRKSVSTIALLQAIATATGVRLIIVTPQSTIACEVSDTKKARALSRSHFGKSFFQLARRASNM